MAIKGWTVVIFVLVFFSLSGCGTTTGSYVVSFSSYSRSNVSALKFCVKRIRFKTDGETTSGDPSSDEDNIDFDLGEVTIDSSGSNLSSVSVPQGTYKRVEIDLEDHCASGKSLQITNGNGTFSTTQRISVKFEGTFTAEKSAEGALELGIQLIINALDTVTNNSEIRDQAESVSGTL